MPRPRSRDSADRSRLDGRAPFTIIGAALGVSDQTVARRYRKLRSTGALRVLGLTDARRLGHVEWLVCLRCVPGAAEPIATALAAQTPPGSASPRAAPRSSALHEPAATSPATAGCGANCPAHHEWSPSPRTASSACSSAARPAGTADPNPPSIDASNTSDTPARSSSTSTSTPAYSASPAKPCCGYPSHPAKLADLGATLATHPEVAFAAATTGPTNLVALSTPWPVTVPVSGSLPAPAGRGL
ncbi:AsnC family transcriptional regulator [Nocardia asteroides]|nr:AsnC family transcriptional regulator [Nocardia asteroides]